MTGRERDFKITAWPLVSHTSNSHESTTDVLWPFIHYERKGTKSQFRLRPFLFWFDKDTATNMFHVGLLFYMILYRRLQQAKSWLVLPLLMYASVNAALAETQTVMLAGLVWYRRRPSYRYVHALPLFFWRRVTRGEPATIHQEFLSILGIYWRWISPNRHIEWAFVYLYYTSGDLMMRHFWPFFGIQVRASRYREYSMFYPFFRVRTNTQLQTFTVHILWPLFKYAKKFDYQSIRMLPFMWVRWGWDHSSGFILLYYWNDTLTHFSRGVLPLFFWRRELAPGKEHFGLTVVLPFYINYKDEEATLRMWTPFYWRYWYEEGMFTLVLPFYISHTSSHAKIRFIVPILMSWNYTFHSAKHTISIFLLFWIIRSSGSFFLNIFPLFIFSLDRRNGWKLWATIIPLAIYFKVKNTSRFKLRVIMPLLFTILSLKMGSFLKVHLHMLWPMIKFVRSHPHEFSLRIFPFIFASKSLNRSYLFVLPFMGWYRSLDTKMMFGSMLMLPPYIYMKGNKTKDIFMVWPFWTRVMKGREGIPKEQWSLVYYILWPIIKITRRNLDSHLVGTSVFLLFRTNTDLRTKEHVLRVFWLWRLSLFTYHLYRCAQRIPRPVLVYIRTISLWPVFRFRTTRSVRLQELAMEENTEAGFWNDVFPLTKSIYDKSSYRSFHGDDPEPFISTLEEIQLSICYIYRMVGWFSLFLSPSTSDKPSKLRFVIWLILWMERGIETNVSNIFVLYFMHPALACIASISNKHSQIHYVLPLFWRKKVNRADGQCKSSRLYVLWLLPRMALVHWTWHRRRAEIQVYRYLLPLVLYTSSTDVNGVHLSRRWGVLSFYAPWFSIVHWRRNHDETAWFLFPIAYYKKQRRTSSIFAFLWIFHPLLSMLRIASDARNALIYCFPFFLHHRKYNDQNQVKRHDVAILNLFMTSASIFHYTKIFDDTHPSLWIHLYPLFMWRQFNTDSSTFLFLWAAPYIALGMHLVRSTYKYTQVFPLFAKYTTENQSSVGIVAAGHPQVAGISWTRALHTDGSRSLSGWIAFLLHVKRETNSTGELSCLAVSILYLLYPPLAFARHWHEQSSETNYEKLTFLLPVFIHKTQVNSTETSTDTAVAWFGSSAVSLARRIIVESTTQRSHFFRVLGVVSMNKEKDTEGLQPDFRLGILSLGLPMLSLFYWRQRSTPEHGKHVQAFIPLVLYYDCCTQVSGKQKRLNVLLLFDMAHHAEGTFYVFVFPLFYLYDSPIKSTRCFKILFLPAPREYPLALVHWFQSPHKTTSHCLVLYYFWKEGKADADTDKKWAWHWLWFGHRKLALASLWRYCTAGAHERQRIYEGFYIVLLARWRRIRWFGATGQMEETEHVLSLAWLLQRNVALLFYSHKFDHISREQHRVFYLLFLFFYQRAKDLLRLSFLFFIFRQLALLRVSRTYQDAGNVSKLTVFPLFKYKHTAGKSTQWAFLILVPVRYSFTACAVAYEKYVLARGESRSTVQGGQRIEKEDKKSRRENRYLRVFYRVFQWTLEDQVKTVQFNPFYYAEVDPHTEYKMCNICGGCLGKEEDHGNQKCRICCCCFV